MKIKTRFIKSVIAAAENDQTEMPWARGARRIDTVSRRTPARTDHTQESA